MAGTVGYEAGDGVATLTLDRPGRLNAITPELADDLDAALARATTWPRRCAVATRPSATTGRSRARRVDVPSYFALVSLT